MNRPSWDEFFIAIAIAASKRSTCNRAMVGAVVVKNNRVKSIGYNGSVSGHPHCTEVGHLMENGHCVRTIHAEMNALINAKSTSGATLYCTHLPCFNCSKHIIQAGIKKVVYYHNYRNSSAISDLYRSSGVVLTNVFTS